MKRTITIILITILLLGSISLIACGNKDGSTTSETSDNPNSSSTSSDTIKTTTKSQSADTGNWGIPIYPKYDSESEFYVKSDQNQFLNDKPAVYESRFITTSDKFDTVVAFYKEKMLANGWEEKVWGGSGGSGGMYVGQYEKNGGKESAGIAIGDDGDGTSIQLGWTYEK